MRLRSICPSSKHISIQPLASPDDFTKYNQTQSFIGVASPASFLRLEQEDSLKIARKPSLVVLEDLHLMDEEYELATARILSIAVPARTRIVGLTSSINDPSDLAQWLGVDPPFCFAFYPRDRSTPLLVSIKSFTIAQSATLLKTMVKPAYDVVKKTTPAGRTLIFVPSRGACKIVANDLVTQSGTELDLNGFLSAPRENVEPYLQQLRDQSLYEPLLHGIGYAIPGGHPKDLGLVLSLFASGIIRALIVPRESCWTLPLRAASVVILGAQYTVGTRAGDRQVVNYSRTELVKMQSSAVESANHTIGEGRVFVMCQSEQSTTISRILNDGLPVESSIPALLKRQSGPEATAALTRMIKPRQPPPPPQINRRRVPDLRKRDIMDLLGWTYFSHRLQSNPTYYDLTRGSEAEQVSRLIDKWIEGSGDEYGPVPSASPSSAGSKVTTGATVSPLNSSSGSGTGMVSSQAMTREGSGEGSAVKAITVGEIGEEVMGEAGVATDGETLDN